MNYDNIKEVIESIAFCVFAVIAIWLFCAATPNQFSGEGDWNEQAIQETADEDERGECAAPREETQTRAEALAEEYAQGDLVFAGAKMKDLGRKVEVTLTFARK